MMRDLASTLLVCILVATLITLLIVGIYRATTGDQQEKCEELGGTWQIRGSICYAPGVLLDTEP